jgi:hypothetical protein
MHLISIGTSSLLKQWIKPVGLEMLAIVLNYGQEQDTTKPGGVNELSTRSTGG